LEIRLVLITLSWDRIILNTSPFKPKGKKVNIPLSVSGRISGNATELGDGIIQLGWSSLFSLTIYNIPGNSSLGDRVIRLVEHLNFKGVS
jgi:hypothetical protein